MSEVNDRSAAADGLRGLCDRIVRYIGDTPTSRPASIGGNRRRKSSHVGEDGVIHNKIPKKGAGDNVGTTRANSGCSAGDMGVMEVSLLSVHLLCQSDLMSSSLFYYFSYFRTFLLPMSMSIAVLQPTTGESTEMCVFRQLPEEE